MSISLACLPPILVLLAGITLFIIGNQTAKKNRPAPAKSFRQVEEEFNRLKAQFAVNQLSEAQFKARLQELMVQDVQGRWWMIGYETGQWYVHDGQHWNPSQIGSVVELKPQSTDAQKKATHGADVMRWIALLLFMAGLYWSFYVLGSYY